MKCWRPAIDGIRLTASPSSVSIHALAKSAESRRTQPLLKQNGDAISPRPCAYSAAVQTRLPDADRPAREDKADGPSFYPRTRKVRLRRGVDLRRARAPRPPPPPPPQSFSMASRSKSLCSAGYHLAGRGADRTGRAACRHRSMKSVKVGKGGSRFGGWLDCTDRMLILELPPGGRQLAPCSALSCSLWTIRRG